MDEGEFIVTLILGGMIGIATMMLIQWYGRRKVKAAMKQDGPSPTRQTELLVNENEHMRGQMGRLEERLSVMERITTDQHMSLNQEIERLR